MANDRKQPTQKTPAGKEIPVPKRRDVMRDLKKIAHPAKGKK
jgi:hypothetical protein